MRFRVATFRPSIVRRIPRSIASPSVRKVRLSGTLISVVGSECPTRRLVQGYRSQVTLLPMNTPRSLALFATLILTIAPCRADKDVAISQLPRPVLKAVEARYPSGHILEAELDSEGYYEIKVQNGQTRHLLHVRPKGKIFKDELD